MLLAGLVEPLELVGKVQHLDELVATPVGDLREGTAFETVCDGDHRRFDRTGTYLTVTDSGFILSLQSISVERRKRNGNSGSLGALPRDRGAAERDEPFHERPPGGQRPHE